jgi:hypothetical protein
LKERVVNPVPGMVAAVVEKRQDDIGSTVGNVGVRGVGKQPGRGRRGLSAASGWTAAEQQRGKPSC